MSPLSVVADNGATAAKIETVSERVRRLQAEARTLAKDHVHEFTRAIAAAERLAAEIAEGGEAYPPGVRDLARRFAEEAEARVHTLEAIVSRS